jgi:hypothetical protein
VKRLALVLAVAVVAVGAGAASGERLPGVKTPNGNISCYFETVNPGGHGFLYCNVKAAVYLGRLQAACLKGPGLDWRGFILPSGNKPQVLCAGGFMHDPSDVPTFTLLVPGQSWRYATFTCTLETNGLTCATSRRHGLFLSRRSWRGW